ncbi:hypothetical protein Syun_031612 [Stephania yunnanensis]|uniref:Uncharacterized protein n=1 Tax=Stephania yunnanensis TaxID=152371 RepID=A0AAP0DZB7_9MAGN
MSALKHGIVALEQGTRSTRYENTTVINGVGCAPPTVFIIVDEGSALLYYVEHAPPYAISIEHKATTTSSREKASVQSEQWRSNDRVEDSLQLCYLLGEVFCRPLLGEVLPNEYIKLTPECGTQVRSGRGPPAGRRLCTYHHKKDEYTELTPGCISASLDWSGAELHAFEPTLTTLDANCMRLVYGGAHYTLTIKGMISQLFFFSKRNSVLFKRLCKISNGLHGFSGLRLGVEELFGLGTGVRVGRRAMYFLGFNLDKD